jgi:uncharacterized membrane protein
MTEDLLVLVGVLLASAVCGWYVVHSISGIVLLVPADGLCGTATTCLPVALGY